MNKSKFLKRSLATLLAILMVVAMVPMSAFAAAVVAQDVPTARVTDNPGYEIALNGIPFTWNSALGRYETDFGFVNDGLGTVPSVQLSMIENEATKNTSFILTDTNQTLTFTNKLVSLTSAAKKENEMNYGQADYIFTLETRTETETGQERNSYELVVKARIRPASAVTQLLGVYAAQMPDMKTYTIENYENGGGKVTIYMTLNRDLPTSTAVYAGDGTDGNVDLRGIDTGDNTFPNLKEIFVADSTVSNMSLNNGQLTITAENGHTDTYEVVLTHEEAFSEFALESKDGTKKYVATAYKNDPQRLIIDLPYDDYYIGTAYNAAVTPDMAAIKTEIQKLIPTWTTDRSEAVVKYVADAAAAATTATTAVSGETTINFASVTKTDDASYYPNPTDELNPINTYVNDNAYLMFTTRSSKAGNGIFVDTLSRKVDSFNDYGIASTGSTAEHAHYGEVEVIVRVPKYNPNAKIIGIQVKGQLGNGAVNPDNVVEDTNDGSQTWSQYIPVTGNTIDITVPKDVLQDYANPNNINKKDEVNNKRAYIKLWGAYGAVAEIPWDFVAKANVPSPANGDSVNPNMDANGFNTDSGNSDDGIFVSGGKTASYVTSESTILLTETNNSTTPQIKTVRIEVKSQDGNHTDTYNLRVRELDDNAHVTDLDSITLYSDAECTKEVAKATKVAGKSTEWTIALPYWMGSEDEGNNLIESYYIAAVAKNGGRISYKNDQGTPSTGAAPADDDKYTAFVKRVDIKDLVGIPSSTASGNFVAKEPNDQTRIRPAAGNEFILRVWDDTDITDNQKVGTDHKITFTMPAPDKEQRISKITLMADYLDNDGLNGHEFDTTIDNINKVITVNLPYEYRDIPNLYISELELDGIGGRVYWNGSNLEELAYKTNVMTLSHNDITPDSGADWQEDRSTKLYVFSEETYSKITHGYSKDGIAQATIPGGTISTWPNTPTFQYYTEYKVVAKIGAAERANRLNNTVKASDPFVTVDVDEGAQIITVTVPNSYRNNYGTAYANNPTGMFTLDFKTDGEKARVYMGAKNDDTNSDYDNVQYRNNNGIPAGGIDKYKAASGSNAIVPNGTQFWVTAGASDADAPMLWYNTSTQSYASDRQAKEAIVAAEYSMWGNTQENGGTRPYRINVKIADPETDPTITNLTVGGVAARLVEDADAGTAIWTVNLPITSDPHQPMKVEFKGNFTTATIDGESFDEKAYYIVNKYAPVTIVATSESGVNKRYILKVEDGNASSDNSLSSVRVGGYPAVRNGATNEYVVTVGDNVDLKALPLYVTTNDSKATVTVNDLPYREAMEISLDGQSAKIIVTAENGDAATYTLSVGQAPVEKPSDKYTDLNNIYLKDEVKEAIDLGIVTGTSATTFTPNRPVTRKEFAVMIARADIIADGKASTTSAADEVLKTEYLNTATKFTDIASQADVYKAAIAYCSTNNIITGTGDGTTFTPDGTITREQAATMLARWTKTTSDSTTNTKFSDWNSVSSWAKGAVNGVTSANPAIMNGVSASRFAPKEAVTRDMAATLVKRVYVNYSSK